MMEVAAQVAERKRKNSRLMAESLGQGFEAKKFNKMQRNKFK